MKIRSPDPTDGILSSPKRSFGLPSSYQPLAVGPAATLSARGCLATQGALYTPDNGAPFGSSAIPF